MPNILVGSCWVLPHVTPISTQAHADAFGGCYIRCSEIASEAILGPLLFRITHFFTFSICMRAGGHYSLPNAIQCSRAREPTL